VFLSDWLGFPHGMAATNRVRLEARAMAESGAVPHVLCLHATERAPNVDNTSPVGEWHGVTFEYACGTTLRHPSFAMRRLIEVRGWSTGLLRLVQLRRADRLDCVYLWFTCQRAELRRAVFGGLLRLLGVPVAMELNERPWSLRDDANRLERRLSPLVGVDGAVSISRYLSDWAAAESARLRRAFRIAEVPILMDLAEQPAPSGAPEGDPLVVFAGAPQYDATVAFIIEAMRHVWVRFPTCRLAITGARPGDPAADALAAMVSAADVRDDRVQLIGYLPRADLLGLYSEAHALLIPLFDDVRSAARFPTKMGEYLASARPVVTSGVGEMARVFTDGVDAMVAPPGDPEAFAGRICDLLADEDLSSRIGAAGREYARTHFRYELHGPALVEFFTELREACGSRMRLRAARPGRRAGGEAHRAAGA
jgi:glycosyltransferase involved in cell wall biosynthesis